MIASLRILRILCTAIFLSPVIFPANAGAENNRDKIPLAEIPGADMTIFDLYMSHRDDAELSAKYAGIFLTGIDTVAGNGTIASMSRELARYYEKERFLFSQAIGWEEKALEEYRTLGDRSAQALSEYNLAKLFYKKGQYHKTLQYTNSAKSYFESSKDTLNLLNCYNLLGIVYHICQNYEKSNDYFRAYAKGARVINDSTKLILALNNSAGYANSIKDSAKTRQLVAESIELSKQIGDSSRLCKMYLNFAAVFLNGAQDRLCREYLDKAAPLLRKIDDKGQYYLIQGILQESRGEKEQAILSFEKAVENYEAGEFETTLQDCYFRLQQLYGESGDTARAYRSLLRYNEIGRELAQDKVFLELFRYQDQLMEKSRTEQASEKKNRIIIYSAVSCISILLLTVFLYFLHRKKNERLRIQEQEIRTQNDLLQIRRTQQFQLKRITDSVIRKLGEVSLEIRESAARTKIRAICQDLKQVQDEEQWKELNNFIPDFNGEFYQKLIKDFPNLTVNERRLCVLLNKNLTTKEISEITRQSPQSINTARGRLRDKLGLTGGSVSIQEFLAKYN